MCVCACACNVCLFMFFRFILFCFHEKCLKHAESNVHYTNTWNDKVPKLTDQNEIMPSIETIWAFHIYFFGFFPFFQIKMFTMELTGNMKTAFLAGTGVILPTHSVMSGRSGCHLFPAVTSYSHRYGMTIAVDLFVFQILIRLFSHSQFHWRKRYMVQKGGSSKSHPILLFLASEQLVPKFYAARPPAIRPHTVRIPSSFPENSTCTTML